jgi:hypothetical protein
MTVSGARKKENVCDVSERIKWLKIGVTGARQLRKNCKFELHRSSCRHTARFHRLSMPSGTDDL